MAQLIKYLLHNYEGLYLHTRTPRLMCKTLHSGVHMRLDSWGGRNRQVPGLRQV